MAPAARGRERGQFAKAALRCGQAFPFLDMCRTSQGFLATLLVAALWAASSAVSGGVGAGVRRESRVWKLPADLETACQTNVYVH